MKTNSTPSAAYYSALVARTRRHGHCYLHAGMPTEYAESGIRFTVKGYGRSLLSRRGHKYKAYAHCAETGRIIKTKEL